MWVKRYLLLHESTNNKLRKSMATVHNYKTVVYTGPGTKPLPEALISYVDTGSCLAVPLPMQSPAYDLGKQRRMA